MIRIIVASKNPVKVQAVTSGFEQMFPDEELQVEMQGVPSGVSDQPMTSEETLRGARQRAINAQESILTADYWAGVEGGVEESETGLEVFAWIVILSRERIGMARTGSFFLPPKIAELVRSGKELGDADDIVFGRSNSKQQNGAIGILTDDAIDRARYYEQAVIMALIPFKNPELYS
ncbi:MAG: inosine/xanthosine triphosphatase [Anaerolineaceae bacterium]